MAKPKKTMEAKIRFKGGTSGGTKHMNVTSVGDDYVYGTSDGQGITIKKGDADYAAAMHAYKKELTPTIKPKGAKITHPTKTPELQVPKSTQRMEKTIAKANDPGKTVLDKQETEIDGTETEISGGKYRF